jgi:hypothetical protein
LLNPWMKVMSMIKWCRKATMGSSAAWDMVSCTCSKAVCPYFVGLTNMKGGVEDPNQILIGKSCVYEKINLLKMLMTNFGPKRW